MKMKALISDIHANFDALSCVCNDIESRGIEDIICLGDIVGYGPQPEDCTDMVMTKASVSLMGNHDYALLNGPIGFNPVAAEAIRYTQERMIPSLAEQASGDHVVTGNYFPCACENKTPKCMVMEHTVPSRWKFMEELVETWRDENTLFVHGSALDPINEYVFPSSYVGIWNPERIQRMFEKTDWLIFCGHTHLPCIITSDMRSIFPQDVNYRFSLDPKEKYIINIGSVGQPRDRDNRSCYCLFDEKNRTIEWRRIPYDIESVVKKIEAICGIDNWCGERLRLGR
ncbi:MAG: metallophosphoesterase [Chitinivibrionales bacterium]|nr:metallophosphoesterase [Chitinivibrionales bacterium]